MREATEKGVEEVRQRFSIVEDALEDHRPGGIEIICRAEERAKR